MSTSTADNSAAYKMFLERLQATPQARIHLGLEVMRDAVSQEGLLRPAPTIVTVAGTNGKGTVAAALSQLCTHRGLKTTLLTSPHLIDYRERIRIDGLPISESALSEIGDRILERYGGESNREPRPLSYFELGVLLGLAAAKQSHSDVLIMEVGVGGRLDATNVIDADLAVFASISLDHTDLLGDTLDAIAFEKSQVARSGRPALVHRELAGVEELTCELKQLGATCYQVDGGHDARSRNLALAAGAFALLESRIGSKSSDLYVHEVLHDFQWPGRLSWLHSPTGTRALLDGAHNAASALELRRTLDDQPPKFPLPAVVSLSGGRQVADVIGPIAPYVSTWHVCAPEFERVTPSAQLAEGLQAWEAAQILKGAEPAREVVLHESVSDALLAAEAQNRTQNTDGILVFGSLYLVADVYAEWATVDDLSMSLSKTNQPIEWRPHTGEYAPELVSISSEPTHTVETRSLSSESTSSETKEASSPVPTLSAQGLREFLTGPWFPQDDIAETGTQKHVEYPRFIATVGAFSAIFIMVLMSYVLRKVPSLYTQVAGGTLAGNLIPGAVLIMALGIPRTWRFPSSVNALRALWMGVIFSLAGTFLTGFLNEIYTLALDGTALGPMWDDMMRAREASYDNILGPKTVGGVIAAVVVVSILPGVCEEFLFRGVLYRVMQRIVVWRRVLFIGVLFSLIHFDVVGFIPLVLLGVLLTWLRALSGSWAYSAIVHIAFNGTALGLGLLSLSGVFGDLDATEPEKAGLLPVMLLLAPALLYSWYLFRDFGRRMVNSQPTTPEI